MSGAGPHGDPDIGGGERRRVVDPVSGHGDGPAVALQPLDDLGLLVRQHLRLDFAQPQPAPHRLRGLVMVTREHDDCQAQALEFGQHPMRRGLDRIRDPDRAGQAPVDRGEDHGGALPAQRLGVRCQRGGIDAGVAQVGRTAHRDPLPVDAARRALARYGREGLDP